MATYRARLESGKAAANGDVHFDCYIECETEPDVWVLAANGHRTLELNGATILSITESALTDQKKLDAVKDLLKAKAEGWGIHVSDDACTQYDSLVPSWPVNIDLD